VPGQPDWDKLNREAVLEVRRLSALKLAKPDQGPDQGLATLARKLKISRQAIALWEARVPEAHVPAIKRILGIPQYKLRGDKWKPPREANGNPRKANGNAPKMAKHS
jgi:hypothetical protein